MSDDPQEPHDPSVPHDLQTCTDVYPPFETPYDLLMQAMSDPDADLETELDRLAMPANKQWDVHTHRVLRVRFLDGNPIVQRRVTDTAQEWSRHCAMEFDFGDDPDAEIRVTFTRPGSWSYVGTDALGIDPAVPTMNYGWLRPTTADDEVRRVVLHEFGHALGLIHEHQSPAADIPWDKEAVYAYYAGPPNNWSRQQTDVNLFKLYRRFGTRTTKFDTQSIMLYPIPREFVTDPAYVVGWNRRLSPTDIAAIGKWYPRR